MPKTHKQIIEDTEKLLLKAMIHQDFPVIRQILDPKIVYIHENGEVFSGIENIPILDPEKMIVNCINVTDRTFQFFNNIAIVHTVEERTGNYKSMPFKSLCIATRTWQFYINKWKLIASNIICI